MKFGWIGIVAAFAVYCGAWTSGNLSWQTSTPGAGKTTAEQPSFAWVEYDEMVFAVNELLWPEMEAEIHSGPFDAGYQALSSKQIQDLILFHKSTRQPFHYQSQSWDCDDFAWEFFYLARVWNMRPDPSDPPPPPAVGLCLIHVNGRYELFGEPIDEEFWHAINVILRDDGQWLFFEPQTGKTQPIEGPIYEGAIEVIKIVI